MAYNISGILFLSRHFLWLRFRHQLRGRASDDVNTHHQKEESPDCQERPTQNLHANSEISPPPQNVNTCSQTWRHQP